MKIVKATYSHLLSVASRPAQGDISEWEAATGCDYDPDEVLAHLRASTGTVTLINDDGHVLAVGGTQPQEDLSCLVWFVTHSRTESLSLQDKRRFWATINQFKYECLRFSSYLFNIVHSKNTAHISFLKSIGATIYKDEPFMMEASGEVFYLFTIGEP